MQRGFWERIVYSIYGMCKCFAQVHILIMIVILESKMPFAEAVNRAVDECIREGVLADFLSRNKSEVVAMSIFEYDEEEHMRLERRDAKAEGKAEGKAESVIELLEELGMVPEKLKNRIMEESDLTLIKDWHIKAARAESIEGFIEGTNIDL